MPAAILEGGQVHTLWPCMVHDLLKILEIQVCEKMVALCW